MNGINVLILKLMDSIVLSSVLPSLKDSHEKTVIALYQSTVCTNAHNTLWDLY